MADDGVRQRVFFKCKYCKILFDDATSLVAHKRFEHADQIFGKSPNNNKTDWDPIRSAEEKSPTKIQKYSAPVFSAQILLNEQPEPSTYVLKIPGISNNQKPDADEKARLKCRFCSKILPTTEKLCEHERTHTGEKPYQCQHCLRGFSEKSAAETHEEKCPVLDILKSEVKKERKKPSNATKASSQNGFELQNIAQSVSVRKKAESGDYLNKRISYTRRFSCPICTKNFKYACLLASHKKTHERSHAGLRNPADYFHIVKTEKVPFLPQLLKCIGSQGQVNFSCQQCMKRLTTRFSGTIHLQMHFGKNLFTCPISNKTFSTMKEVVTHFSAYPSNITSGLEDVTEISAYATRYLETAAAPERYQDTDTHYTVKEDVDHNCKVFACKLCDYKVSSRPRVGRKQIRDHVRQKHTKTSLFHCDHCQRGYAYRCQLRKHIPNCKLNTATSVNTKPATSNYLKKRMSFTRKNFPSRICHQNLKNTWRQCVQKKTHDSPHWRTGIQTDTFSVLETEKVPFIPQLLKCIGSEGQFNYSCEKCDQRFKSKRSGWEHLWKHFGKKVFTCPACTQKYLTMKEAVAHFQSHPASSTSNLEDAAVISEFVSTYLYKMGASERNQDTIGHYTEEDDLDNQRKIFKCKECDYKLFSKPGASGHAVDCRYRMRIHIRRIHTRTNLYTCDNCQRGYAEKKDLRNHSCKRRPHQGKHVTVKVEGLKCPVCAIVFDNNEALAAHNDGHSKLPFLCVKCGLWFRLAQDIKQHLITCAK